jgi:hypothetical protein
MEKKKNFKQRKINNRKNKFYKNKKKLNKINYMKQKEKDFL